MNKAYLGMLILALTCLQWGCLNTPQASAQQSAQAVVGPNQNPNQDIIDRLQDILRDQARFGNTPRNNRLLQQIQNIANGSPAILNPSSPQVTIWNQGPGALRVQMGNAGNYQMVPAYQSAVFPVSKGMPLNLQSSGQWTRVNFMQHQRGNLTFWDKDDQRDYPILVNRWSRNVTSLANGEVGYQIYDR